MQAPHVRITACITACLLKVQQLLDAKLFASLACFDAKPTGCKLHQIFRSSVLPKGVDDHPKGLIGRPLNEKRLG